MDPKCIYSASDIWVLFDNFKMDLPFDVNTKKTCNLQCRVFHDL